MARKSKELNDIIELFDKDDFIEEEQIDELTIDAKFIQEFNNNTCYIVDSRKLGAVLHSRLVPKLSIGNLKIINATNKRHV